MTDKLINLPLTYEVQTYENKINLPSVEEIKQHGLSKELVAKLRDFNNSQFDNDIIVSPLWSEEWEDLRVSCMASGCGNTYVSYWQHANCFYSYPGRIQWSTHANLKCPSCNKVSDISRWSFKCHGSGHDYQTTDLITLTDVVSALLEYDGANRQFASKFSRSAKEILKN